MAIIHCPGVCRYTLYGQVADRPWNTIMDFRIDTTGSVVSRSEAIYGIAGDIINNFLDEFRDRLSPDATLAGIRWLDLDALDGETGQRTSTSEYTLPLSGEASSGTQTGGDSILIHKNLVGAARNARSGQWYFAGVAQAAIQENQVIGSVVAAMNTELATFLANVNDSGAPIDRSQRMCVIHTPGIATYSDGEVYEATSTDVDSLTVDPRAATQRRRTRA